MHLDIFDVEHGACSLLTCDNGCRMMIDCGHNVSTSWRPHHALRAGGANRLEQLAVTNYDEDHVSGLPELRQHFSILNLLRNPTVSPSAIRHLKTEDGMGRGIESLVDMAEIYTGPPAPVEFPGVERSIFYHRYPEDFDDENNLSMVLHIKVNNIGFLFPGDLETAGWLKLLQNDQFASVVRSTSVLIASHHGRRNGVCEELFSRYGCAPFFVVISDKGYQHDTQETVPFYRERAKGGTFRGEKRHVLTTRNDGAIRFNFTNSQWWPS